MTDIHHKQILVTGRVQGVFYRASTVNRAIELGIKGYVKNRNDGSVFIEAEGTSDQLMVFIDWCRQGPTYAIVDSLEEHNGVVVGFKNFEIRR